MTHAIKGRGATANPAGRFEAQHIEAVDDGWQPEGDEDAAAPRTRLTAEASRSIVSTNDSPDIPFDRSINPYKGCEHGCVYCFARPTHAYLGLSPGLDFETRIFFKPDAPRLLRETFARKGYRPEVIAVGANTDPYQPAERRLRITRAVLEVMAEHAHPVAIVTKSDLVLRDRDLLEPMAEARLVQVFVSVTTLDPELARRMEPRAAIPARRLAAIEGLAGAGVPVGVLASPMIPGLNDHELERILAAASSAGARYAGTILLRLPHELRELVSAWLAEHYPNKQRKVLALLREARGGALYDSRFGQRMRGQGVYADLLQARFRAAVARYGLSTERQHLDTSRFRSPRQRQLDLFTAPRRG